METLLHLFIVGFIVAIGAAIGIFLFKLIAAIGLLIYGWWVNR